MTFPSHSDGVLSILIFSPLLAGAIAACLKGENLLRWWTLASTTLVALFSLTLCWRFDPGTAAFQFQETVEWIPALRIKYALGLDGISLLLVLMTTLIMPLCVLASWRYIQARLKEFMLCLLLMETAMVGVFCALDFILFFVFWEAMLIPMALLIGIWGGPRKVYAALKFFVYTMFGSVFLLVAIIALYTQRHTFSIPDLMGQPYSPAFQYWVFLAFFISFAIKVPMLPFHTWLPAAHVEAPTAGSVLLASILLKMGTYGFLRFSLPITPDASRFFTPYILWLSVAAIIYGGLTALAQSDLKKLVAYSSVAHMGFATLGIFALNQMGVEGALLVMVNHGITTGALFIAVGIIYERLHTRDLDQASGLGKAMPVLAAFAGVFALSSLAFPGTNSFIGEFLVLSGGFARVMSINSPVSKALMICVVPGVVLAAAYMLRLLQKVAYGGTRNPDHSHLKDLCWHEVLALAPLLVFVFWIGLHPAPFTRVMHASVRHLLQQSQATPEIRTAKSDRTPTFPPAARNSEDRFKTAKADAFREFACPVSDAAVPKGHPRIARRFNAGVGRPSCPARPEGTIESSAQASPLAGGVSTVPSGRIRVLCPSDPALKRWAILMKSLRDKGLAEFPKGIAAKADVFLPPGQPRPHPLQRLSAAALQGLNGGAPF